MHYRQKIAVLILYVSIAGFLSGLSHQVKAQDFDLLYDSLFEMAASQANIEDFARLHYVLAEQTMNAALYDLSLQHAKEVLTLEVTDQMHVDAYNLIGMNESYRYKYKESIEWLSKAVSIIDTSAEEIFAPRIYHNLGESYGLLGSMDSMKVYFQKSIAERKIQNQGSFDFKEMFDEAIMFFYNKENNKAKAIFEKLGKEHKSDVSEEYLARIYGYISLINKRNGQFNDCILSASRQLEFAEAADFNPERIYAYKFLSDCNEGLQNYEEALGYRSIYFQLKDSLRANAEETRMKALKSSNDYLGRIRKLESENEIQMQNLIQEKNIRYRLLGLLFLSGLVIAASIFIARLRKERERLNKVLKNKAEEALNQKSLLLKEVHHRVKNNLQSLSGLLFLQANKIEDVDSKMLLNQTQKRLNAISLLHEDLYAPDASHAVDFGKYLEKLGDNNRQTLSREVDIVIRCEPLYMDLDTAMPLALICNELITNSIKHAQMSLAQMLEIHISCTKIASGVEIIYYDNGRNFNLEDRPASFGLYLIDSLLKKYKGDIDFTQNEQDKNQFTILLNDITLINITP